MLNKRSFIGGGMIAALAAATSAPALAAVPANGLGQIARLTAKPGQEAALRKFLADHADFWSRAPECLAYVVSEDAKVEGVFWVTEYWVDAAGHKRATSTDEARAIVAENRTLISGYEPIAAFRPIAGTLRSG